MVDIEVLLLGKQTSRYIQEGGPVILKTSKANANWERMGLQGPGRWRWGDGTGRFYLRIGKQPTMGSHRVPNGEEDKDGFTRNMLRFGNSHPHHSQQRSSMSKIFASPYSDYYLIHLSAKVTEYLPSEPGTRLGMGDTAMPRQDEVLFYLELGV